MLDGVDAASIAVPTTLHFQVAADCLAVGVDVLLEKPMARSVKEADRLVRTAQREGRVLQVGHVERFNPPSRN